MTFAIITNETLEDIADAIRDVTGGEGTYLPSEMPDAIRGLSAGGAAFEPQPVTGISAKVGHGKVGLLFDDPEDLSYLGYDIYEWAGTKVVRKAGTAPSSQSDGALVANSTTHDGHVSSYLEDTGLVDGTTYYYGLFPYTTEGVYNTDPSQIISATPSALAVGTASALAAKIGNGKATVKWSDPADVADTASRYGTAWEKTELVRKEGSVPSDPSDGTLVATSTARDQYSADGYTDAQLENGTAYYYGAFAYSSDGEVSDVVAVAATPSALGIGACTDLAVTAGNGTAAIKWSDPSDVADTSARYGADWARTVLVRKEGSAPTSPSDGTVVVTETTRDQYSDTAYDDTGLTNGTEYHYAAFAVSSDGVTSTAATASATPTAFDPSSITWANGTWDEIATMVQKHRDGEIDIKDYWHVGDVREVPFTLYKTTVTDAAGASNVEPGYSSKPGCWHDGSSWVDVGSGVNLTTHWVLADVNDGSSSATAKYAKPGQSAPAFIVHQVECLVGAWMNFSNVNNGGWDSSALRKYINGSYLASGITGYYDGLPEGFRSILLPAAVVASQGSTSHTSTTTSTDKLFLPAEKEVFGSVTYANDTAETSLVQWDYFADSAKRVKYRLTPSGAGSANSWWERSPYSGDSNYFCLVNSNGAASSYIASYTRGLAPSGCI